MVSALPLKHRHKNPSWSFMFWKADAVRALSELVIGWNSRLKALHWVIPETADRPLVVRDLGPSTGKLWLQWGMCFLSKTCPCFVKIRAAWNTLEQVQCRELNLHTAHYGPKLYTGPESYIQCVVRASSDYLTGSGHGSWYVIFSNLHF